MKKEAWLIVSGVSFLLFVLSLSLLLADKFQVKSCGCPKVVSYNFIYLFIFLSIIFISSLIYYLASLKIENQKHILKKNLNLVLNFLDRDERQFLNLIIQSKGEILQKELTTKFGKLKSSRVVKRLHDKEIVNVISVGKTHKIVLKPEIAGELLK
jgi:uncharacterized membrane protein